MAASHDDANLILRLYDLRREEKMRQARDWFVRNARFQSFEELMQLCPPGSQENAFLRQVASYWEMVASFLTSGVLDEELFFQSGRELLLVWIRLGPIAPQMRDAYKDPTAYRNLETVATRYIEWMSRQGPDVFSAFAARVK